MKMKSAGFAAAVFAALIVLALASGCYEPVAGPDIPAVSGPRVLSTLPPDGASGVPITASVSAVFSEPMDPASITTSTFTLTGPGATPIPGSVSCTGNTAVFDPASDLPAGTLCTATVAATAADLAGNILGSAYSWTFTTSAAPDTTPPTVTISAPSAPLAGAMGGVSFTVSYNEAGTYGLDPSFVILNKTGSAGGTVSVSGGTTANPVVTVGGVSGDGTLGITISSGAMSDAAGNPSLASFPSATFVVDSTPPAISIGTISTSNPSPGWARAGDTVTVPFTVTDAGSGVAGIPWVTVGGTAATVTGTFPNYNAVYTFTAGDAEGTVSLYISAQDAAGNTGASSPPSGVVLDLTAPFVTIGPPDRMYAKSGTVVTCTVTYTGADTVTLDPMNVILTVGGTAVVSGPTVSGSGSAYTVSVTAFSGDGSAWISIPAGTASDLAGNLAAGADGTAFTVDNTSPAVLSTVPFNGATGVPVDGSITATFTEPVDPASISVSTFLVVSNYIGTPIAGTVIMTGVDAATFLPNPWMPPGHPMTARITAGVTDIAGNMMPADYTWSFTTETALTTPVGLGTAGTYTILAGVGINNIPTSNISGNIGISPAWAESITGFSLSLDGLGQFSTSPEVTGQVHAADYAEPTPTMLSQAVNDLTTAYFDAAGRTPNFVDYFFGDISDRTLAPGVYRWNTSVTINTPVILQGGPGDVFIFQINGGLSAQGEIQLSGGVSPANVFWQVSGGTVNINTPVFAGIVLSQSPIILGGGAKVTGRLLTTTSVDLNQNEITVP